MSTREAICLVAVCATTALTAAATCSAAAGTLEAGLVALRAGYDTMALPQLEEAERLLRAEAAGPDPSGEAHYHLARALEGLAIYHVNIAQTDTAVRYLQAGVAEAKVALERDPSSSPFHTTLGNLYGQLAGQGGLTDKIRYGRMAVASYNRALELDPRNAMAHVGVGIGKLQTPPMFGGSAVEAIAEFRTAQSLDPSCVEAWTWEGIAQRRQGAVPDARAAFTHALTISPKNDHARRELAALDEDF